MAFIQVLALGLGLVLVIEGLVLALAPDFYERIVQMLRETPPQTRRTMGLLAIGLGIVLLWLARL